MDLDGKFQKPDKDFDSEYEGQYDLWLEGIRVEVKAARAIHTKSVGLWRLKHFTGRRSPFLDELSTVKT